MVLQRLAALLAHEKLTKVMKFSLCIKVTPDGEKTKLIFKNCMFNV